MTEEQFTYLKEKFKAEHLDKNADSNPVEFAAYLFYLKEAGINRAIAKAKELPNGYTITKSTLISILYDFRESIL